MSRTEKNKKLVDEIFKPDINGISDWKTRVEIDMTALRLGRNGNIRQNTPWSDKYKWEIQRENNKPRGFPERFRTIGISDKIIHKRPIRKNIKDKLLKEYKNCRHCGNTKDLCVDHKNDLYNDIRVLDIKTQHIDDFQILCNKCNKDLKHQEDNREKKSGKLCRIGEINLVPYCYDNFDYPWELALTTYEPHNINCKIYKYWYDCDLYKNRYHWYIKLIYVNKLIRYLIPVKK